MARSAQALSRSRAASPVGASADRVGPSAADLKAMGFTRPSEAVACFDQWQRGVYSSTRSTQARRRLMELIPSLVASASASGQPGEVIRSFDGLVRRLMVGTHLFGTLASDGRAFSALLELLLVAPRLGPVLAARPEAFDALVAGAPCAGTLTHAALAAGLAEAIRDPAHPGDVLERVRDYTWTQQFLVGARAMRWRLQVSQVPGAFSRLAEVVLSAVVRHVEAEFQRAHGRIAGGRWGLVALGRFAARDLTATSDLDLLALYDMPSEDCRSDGPVPLPGLQYFGRLVQAVVAALSTPMGRRPLYETDFRLRPWGSKGPLATRLSALTDYYESEAWTFEHMALSRARVVHATPGFAEAMERALSQIIVRRRDHAVLMSDAVAMRQSIQRSKGSRNPFDVKHVRGGSVDIEFIAQTLVLAHAERMPSLVTPATDEALRNLYVADVLSEQDFTALTMAHLLYRDVMQVQRLACPEDATPGTLHPAVAGVLPELLGLPNLATLKEALRDHQTAVRAIFDRLLDA